MRSSSVVIRNNLGDSGISKPVGRKRHLDSIAKLFLSPANGAEIFSAVVLMFYCVFPILIYFSYPVGEEFVQLSAITMCVVFSILVGSKIRICDSRFKRGAKRINISYSLFIFLVWLLFISVVFYTLWSAPSVPIISALRGVSPDELSLERGAFLKGREGLELALLYLSTFLSATLIPYSIVLLYADGSRYRYIASLAFFVFCISFMQKALFLSLVLPLVAYFSIEGKVKNRDLILLVIITAVLLFAVTFLSTESESLGLGLFSDGFFSASYLPLGALDYLVWRSIAVPVFTAADTLLVFNQWFQSAPLFGATSGLLSFLFGLDRVNIERFVFEYQFGSWNEIANSNSVFVVDAYVNFWWIGAIIFGLFVGQIFRCFRLSQDIGFKSLWPLFAFHLFTASLIGTMLSNGFLYMMIHALLVRVRKSD